MKTINSSFRCCGVLVLSLTPLLFSAAADCGLEMWSSRAPLNQPWLRDVAYGSGRFVAVGDQGFMLTSSDGASWQPRSHSYRIAFARVSHVHGQFFATGRRFGTLLDAWEGLLWSSNDGLNWQPRYSETNTVVCGVTHGAGRFVAVVVNAPVNHATQALVSSDGAQWTAVNMPGSGWLYDVTFGNGAFVAVGGQRIMRSTDGNTWQASVPPGAPALQAVEFFDGQFFAVGLDGRILTSPDGIAWTARTSGTTASLSALAAGAGTIAVAGNDGAILTSRDGLEWTPRSIPGPHLRGMTFGADAFVAVGRYSTVLQSGPVSGCDGPSLVIHPGSPTHLGLFGQVGAAYRVEFIDDLQVSESWQTLEEVPALPSSPHSVYDAAASPTGRRFYRALQVP